MTKHAFEMAWDGHRLVLGRRTLVMGIVNLTPDSFFAGSRAGDVETAVESMRLGAYDFIQKPFRDQELLDRIHLALRTDEERRAEVDPAEADAGDRRVAVAELQVRYTDGRSARLLRKVAVATAGIGFLALLGWRLAPRF